MLLHLCSSGSGSTGGSSRKEKRDKMLIYIRLFLGMGITWYFEILNFALSSLELNSSWMVFTDTLNMCQVTHNVLRSSSVVVVRQIFFCHQPNFANDCNGLSYDG